MHLIEVVCSVAVFTAFLGVTASAVQPIHRLHTETQKISAVYERDRFIVNNFRLLCAHQTEAAYADWQQLCASLWQFETFSIESVGWNAEKEKVMVCEWSAVGEKKHHVLALCAEGEL